MKFVKGFNVYGGQLIVAKISEEKKKKREDEVNEKVQNIITQQRTINKNKNQLPNNICHNIYCIVTGIFQ